MRREQEGVSILFLAIVLVGIMAILFGLVALFRSTSDTRNSKEASASLASIQAALERYASITGRLPCPADPTSSTGDANPAVASVACNSPGGTVPWMTIGLRAEDALDPWGWKISYRVYNGVAGSLTQADGASMVACDTSVDPVWKASLDANKLCQTLSGWHSDQADFLNGKGLSITDFGTVQNGVAFILISHGASGLGAYTTTGARKTLPTNAAELGNTQAAGPFTAQAASAPAVGPADAMHFDDYLAYENIADLARHANIAARDWPDPASGLASVKLDTPTLTAAMGQAPAYGDLGQLNIVFNNARVTGFNSGGNANLAFDQVGSNEGLGVTGGGGNGLSNPSGEGVRIDFTQNARRFALTLNDFGTQIFGVYAERVELKFLSGATLVGTITKTACHVGSGLASFASIDPGADFNAVEIRALDTTTFIGTLPSSFFLSEFKTCAAGVACHTSLELPGNICP